jgi:S-DNA-T family DNA segregation ATPase FtsK/SpoIIIE
MSLALKQAIKKNSLAKPLSVHLGRGVREAVLFAFSAVALLLLVALMSYDSGDPGWSHTAQRSDVQNYGGKLGAWFADIFLYLFGYLAYLAPVIVGYSGWLLFRGESDSGKLDLTELSVRWTGFFITLISGCGLAILHFGAGDLPMQAGGLLGQGIAYLLVNALSLVGATLLLLGTFLGGFTLLSGLSWLSLSDQVGGWTLSAIEASIKWIRLQREKWQGKKLRAERQETFEVEHKKLRIRRKPRIEPKLKKVDISSRPAREKQIPLFKSPTDSRIPPIDLLEPPREQKKGYSNASLQAISRQLELKLRDFKVEAVVESVHPGPVVTRFELTLAPGTKVNKITALAKDLARAMSVTSVRVVEVIPGKSTIGIEIPNEGREMVSFCEIISSKVFDSANSPLTLGLGKDIGGKPMVADLAKMPHLLVAGTTGSGKSVAVNAMLLSFLFKSSPDELRMILIDPKMLELSVYDGIPHLLTPVVTDMKDAANALRWCVAEMERRYKLMSAMGVRNMAGFNRKVKEASDKGEPIKDPLWKPNELVENDAALDLEPLPYISIVVDEFADMMMVVGKKVEELIARLAQKARASGIHLILATQRPSVDVITGLIKANIPSRIAFQVSSKIDSRTILDQMGAEQLLGHGDMLFLPAGTSLPVRIHGAYVSDEEVHHVANFLRSQGEPNYLEEILQEAEPGDADIPGLGGGEDAAPLYDQAVAVVTESRKASISYVQRRLKVGYNRAARMIEQMEATGVVSSVQGSGSREVLAPPPPEV